MISFNTDVAAFTVRSADLAVQKWLDNPTPAETDTVVYSVVLTRSPEEEVRVTASPSLPRESEAAAGGQGVLLKREDDPDDTASAQGVTLLFDRTNWFQPGTRHQSFRGGHVERGTPGT